MECDICHRPHDAQRRPFLCAVDARNRIYDGRMRNLQLMLDNDTLKAQINELLADTRPNKHTRDEAVARKEAAEQKTDQIIAAADKLRGEIKAARDEIQARKAALARRRSDLASVSAGLAERRTKQLKDVEKSIHMLKFRWSQTAEDTASTRAFLCTEAVRLYGLKRVAKKGITGRYEYSLGRIPIVDLTSMDCESLMFPLFPMSSTPLLCSCLYKRVEGKEGEIYTRRRKRKREKITGEEIEEKRKVITGEEFEQGEKKERENTGKKIEEKRKK